MDERVIEVGGISLAVAEAGAGGAPLLLVHGFTGAKEDFTEYLDRLAGLGFHAVAADNRGHGSSAKPADEAAYSLSTFADDLLGLADALGWDRFALLGHSMGGMIAQVMAIRSPARLDSLVLMDTGHGPVEGIDPQLAGMAVEVARQDGLAVLLDLINEHQSPLTSAADARVRAERPGYAEWGDAKFTACSPAMYASMAIEMFEQADRLDDLASLDVPTLVVIGEQDVAFLGPAERLAATIPGARHVLVADAGHSPQFENPGAWWDAVSSFLVAHAPDAVAAD